MTACPPLEDIAAFLDGINLSPEERARITEHLARCESCYETFAGAVHFLEEERESSADDIAGGDVIPFRPLAQEKVQEKPVRIEPPQPVRRVSRWLPLAASVVLMAGLGYMLWQRSQILPEVTVAGVVEPLQGKRGVGKVLYQPERERGEGGDAMFSQAPLFLAGVYLVDLRLSLSEGNAQKTEEILADLKGTLDQVMFVSPEIVTFFENQSQRADFEVLARELPKQESALENELAEEPLFRFGIWAEAARISAKVGAPAFFEERGNRRFLALIPQEASLEGPPAAGMLAAPPSADPGSEPMSAEEERYQLILQDLQKIEPLWDRSPRDYKALAPHFESIIDQFEQIRKEDLSPGSAEEFP